MINHTHITRDPYQSWDADYNIWIQESAIDDSTCVKCGQVVC